jgi:uncharacterized small protein (DUF1192 family)
VVKKIQIRQTCRTLRQVLVSYTVTELEAKIAALELAFERHERTVIFADRQVTYRSFDEIQQQIAYFQSKLTVLRGRPKQSFGVGNKGFCW